MTPLGETARRKRWLRLCQGRNASPEHPGVKLPAKCKGKKESFGRKVRMEPSAAPLPPRSHTVILGCNKHGGGCVLWKHQTVLITAHIIGWKWPLSTSWRSEASATALGGSCGLGLHCALWVSRLSDCRSLGDCSAFICSNAAARSLPFAAPFALHRLALLRGGNGQ